MHDLRCARAVLLAALVLGAAVPAAAQLTRGTISGSVRDTTGGYLPGVTVTITNNSTGLVRTATTDGNGFYRVPALDPGVYTVRFELQGFKVVENREVPVPPTGETTFDGALEIGALTESVDVTAVTEAISLNKTNGSVGQTFSSRQATDLPLSGARNVTNLALLAPSVSSAPGSTGMAANGNRARNNNFMIDGTDNNDISVTIQTVPVVPESVSEVVVQTNPFNVEYGRNSGAQINVVTKGGSNQFHGSAFEYYRDSELNARDNLEKASGQDKPTPFTRHQFGGGMGGPIVRNRAFFYGLFQRDKNEADTLGGTVRVPTPAGFAALQGAPLRAGQPAASRQAVLQQLSFLQDIYAANPAFRNVQTQLVNGVGIETAQINVTRETPTQAWYGVGRGDLAIADGDNITLRYIRNTPDSVNAVSNTAFGPRFAGDQTIVDQNLYASHTRVLTTTALNEARFSWIKRDLQFPENDPTSPTAGISGLFTVGGASNFPQGRVQDSFQFMDVLTFQKGRHSFKAGADIRYLDLDNLAAFDTKGTFTFDSLQDFMNNNARIFSQALQTASFTATQWSQFYFFQDDWRPTPSLAINLGLRYENSTVPLGLFGADDPQVRAALVPGPVKRDNDNFAPRVGFAWSPTPEGGFGRWLLGESTSSIRGGYGKSYDVLFYNILTVNGSNYPRVVVGRLDNALDLYPNVAPVTGAPVFDPLATFVNSPEDTESPETHNWSASWQRELRRNYVAEIGYTGSLGRKGISQDQANYAVLSPDQIATVQRTLNAASIPATQARRLVPQFGSRVLIAATSKSEYHGVYVSLNRRWSRGLQYGLSYTFSRYYSDGDESLGVGVITAGSPQIAQDFANLDVEWSRSVFDRPHRLVVNWIYEVPWFTGGWAQNAVMRHAFSGWQVAGVMQTQSGQPFTILTGVDSNGNGAGGDRPNRGSGSLTPDPTTGNLRTFTNNGAYVTTLGTNGLPLANALGNGNAPRNELRGPGFVNWDLSLSKRFQLFGSHAIGVRADFLNAFNQDTYGNPVSSMASADFGKNLNNWGNRSITLGVNYHF